MEKCNSSTSERDLSPRSSHKAICETAAHTVTVVQAEAYRLAVCAEEVLLHLISTTSFWHFLSPRSAAYIEEDPIRRLLVTNFGGSAAAVFGLVLRSLDVHLLFACCIAASAVCGRLWRCRLLDSSDRSGYWLQTDLDFFTNFASLLISSGWDWTDLKRVILARQRKRRGCSSMMPAARNKL